MSKCYVFFLVGYFLFRHVLHLSFNEYFKYVRIRLFSTSLPNDFQSVR